MGKYDFGSRDKNYDLTMRALCIELLEENCDEVFEGTIDDETFEKKIASLMDKFSNNDSSGLINKLDNKLHFNVNEFHEPKEQEKFAKLKLLKELYYIEKAGEAKTKNESDANTRTRITDIMAKPRLSNISSPSSNNSRYGEIFDDLFQKVEKEVTHSEEKVKTMKETSAYWDYLTGLVFDYVITDTALEHPKSAIKELTRIEGFLQKKIVDKLPEEKKAYSLPHKEKLMDTFFNLLLEHQYLCSENDRLRINYQICMEEEPSEEYIECFSKYDEWGASPDLLPALKSRFQGKMERPDVDIPFLLITGGKPVKETLNDYLFAIDHVEPLLSWIEKKKYADFGNGYPMLILVACIQEIVAVKQGDERFSNDFYGNTYTAKPMLSALKKPDKAEAVLVEAWIIKIENRLAVNFGSAELIKRKRDIENLIFETKKYIYSYQNFEDMLFADRFLRKFVARSMISRGYMQSKVGEFCDKVQEKLIKPIELKYLLFDEAVNVLDMFREFSIGDKENEAQNEVIQALANRINNFYQEESNVIGIRDWYSFSIDYGEGYNRKFVLGFEVNRDCNQFEFIQFYEVQSDEKVNEAIRLGFEKFVLR